MLPAPLGVFSLIPSMRHVAAPTPPRAANYALTGKKERTVRAVDRNPRTKNHTTLTPAQRRLATLVCALRRAQVIESGQQDATEALAPAVAGASWGPFGAFFVTSRENEYGYTYKTVWVNRRPVLTVRLWPDGGHTIIQVFTLHEGERVFENFRAHRRELAAQMAEKAARVRRILGRATPAQRAYMDTLAWGVPVTDPLVVKYGGGTIDGWVFDGGFLINGWERLPAHAAVRSTVSEEEVARTVRDLRQNAERREREAARARAAGVARIGRAVAEAAWTAICLAREAEAEAAARNMRRIHA